jgi:hypothetical protein
MWKLFLRKKNLMLHCFFTFNFTLMYAQSYYYPPQQNQNYYYDENYNGHHQPYNPSQDRYYQPRPGDYANRDPNRGIETNGGTVHYPDYTDWDYHETWRDYRKSFYSGETQAEAYRKSHPYGEGGIGYDPDPVYLRMEEEYRQMKDQQQQGGGGNRQDRNSNSNYRNQGDGSRVKTKTRGNFQRDYDY